MAKDFWFKFYFKDWANDVKPLSLNARGLLTELIIYMNQNTPKGECLNDIRLIVRLTGGLTEEVKAGVDEFRKNGIFDFVVDTNGVETMVSRKIKKEIENSLIAKENGKKGGNPNLKKYEKGLTNGLRDGLTGELTKPLTYNSISNSDNNYSLKRGTGEKLSETEIYPTFDDFWNIYDKKQGREACLKKWSKIPQQEKERIMQTLPDYIRSTPEKKFRKNPETYLNNKSWNDEIIDNTDPRKSYDSTNRHYEEFLNSSIFGKGQSVGSENS